jgi:riboflavin synthase
MFTGIIQEIGKVKSLSKQGNNLAIEVEAHRVNSKLELGASISINGACQTVVARGEGYFKVEAVAETLKRTNLGQLQRGSLVNLENPVSLSDLLHGHLVQGHVDCVSRIAQIMPIDGSSLFAFEYPREFEKFLVEKGSVAVDGVSLTVIEVTAAEFRVSLVPHTLENTTFKRRKVGDTINLEFDLFAKYIDRIISASEIRKPKVTIDYLKEHGF